MENDTFFKTIRKNHILRKPPAIALDLQSLRDAEAAGATHVEIDIREDGTIYRAPISGIWAKGFEFDRGWGSQQGLVLNGWVKTKKGGGLQPDMFAQRETISVS